MCRIVFSCQADFQGVALQEILACSQLKFIKWLDGGVGLLEYAGAFAELSGLLGEMRPVFTRHIFPAEHTGAYTDRLMQGFAERMDKARAFSVQARAAGNSSKPAEIRQQAADYLKSVGFAENKRHPEQVISLFGAGDIIYAGLSLAEQNLSIWSGGMRHYALRADTVSRAGFKLMEALEAYPLDFEAGSSALDLGAAPGGWTKVLIERGLRVTAVDPVQLSPALQAGGRVEYHSVRAHDYIRKSSKIFDLIVNDMSMNIFSSINFVLALKKRLRPGGHVIITFKLTKHDRLNKINEGLALLRGAFEIAFVKQLFHNRSEITVILTH